MAGTGAGLAATSKPPSVPQQAHSLTLSSGVVFATALLIQVLGVVGNIYIYHQIGELAGGIALIGTAQLFLLIGSSINTIGDLRIGSAYTYFLARGKPVTDNTGTYLILRTGMVIAASITLFAIAPLSLHGHQIATGPELVSLGTFLSLPVLWSFSTVYSQMYVGLGNSLRAQFPSLVEAIVRLPILIYAAYHLQTLEGITIAYAVGAAASALFSSSAVWSRIRRFSLAEATHLFRYAWPLMGGLMLNYLVTSMVPLIVDANLGTTQLSVFLTANGWRVLVLSLPTAVATPLFPYLAGLHRQERYEQIRSGTWHALRYTAMLLVPGVVALVTYRSPFLRVFANPLYVGPGAWPLAVLVVAAIPLSLSQIILSSLDAIGRRRLELYITVAQVVVLIAAVVALMPPWGFLPQGDGIIAASIAVLLSGIVAITLNTYFMEKLIRVHIDVKSIVRITVSAAASFASLSFVNHTKIFPLRAGSGLFVGLQLLAVVFIGFGVYFLVLAAIGELTQEDVRRIGSSLNLPSGLYERLARLCRTPTIPALSPVDLERAPGLRSPEFPEPFSGTTELPAVAESDMLERDGGNEGPPPDGAS